ncbi:GTP 3',8-cyclase MoaA [Ampullimonas aquatilis]|uniref:GTP 3',8-cyclase MoaA n=1 Tax=Ampullimonas aquatilis TaxID=1341549 RepID=UPI003C768C63
MSTRNTPLPVIPIRDLRSTNPLPLPAAHMVIDAPLQDRWQRPLRDLRISVTDRCNFRCVYCMPREVFDRDYPFLPHADLLSFEEITRLAKAFAAQGVEKIRLTGGEPLLRKHLERLIEMLASIITPTGKPLDITLTTNGSLLAKKAQSLKDAGLNRITVSLDALDNAVFKQMNDADYAVAEVLAGIEAAQVAGLNPIKVNMVVKRGVNDSELVPMAQHFKGSGVILRFIEYMDVGTSNGWQMDDVVTAKDMLARLQATLPLVKLARNYPGETAQRWAHADGSGELGIIASVTQAFCDDCTRARLSTDGKLYLCLFANQGYDLRHLLRSNPTVDATALQATISAIWQQRDDRYSLLRTEATPLGDANQSRTTRTNKIEMSYIGG